MGVIEVTISDPEKGVYSSKKHPKVSSVWVNIKEKLITLKYWCITVHAAKNEEQDSLN